MAKKGASRKGEINRTDEVRKYMAAHPTESNTEILKGLEKDGVTVSGSLVSHVRKEQGMPQVAGSKKKATKKKAGRKKGAGKKTVAKKPAATATQAAKGSATGRQAITADELYEAKQLADELGGIDRLRKALDALERLQ